MQPFNYWFALNRGLEGLEGGVSARAAGYQQGEHGAGRRTERDGCEGQADADRHQRPRHVEESEYHS